MTTTLQYLDNPRFALKEISPGHFNLSYAMNMGGDCVAEYWRNDDPSGNQDAWRYRLPRISGEGGIVYSHPTESGCKLAFVRHLLDRGILGPDERNIHLDERDTALAAEAQANRDKLTGRPRIGDFVIMPDGTVQRCCNDCGDGMQTCFGGSFSVHPASGGVSMSGSLNRSQLWEYFQPTDQTKLGRFWFFHHNRPGAGCGVDVFLPCRVYRLEPFTMTESEARAHPSARSSAKFWGENHRDHLSRVAALMRGEG